MGQLSFTTDEIDKILKVVAENSKEVTAINETNLEFNNLFKIMGKINLTVPDEITEAQLSLTDTNSVGIYLITDSSGKIPSSTEEGVTLTSEILKQLTLQSPNADANSELNRVALTVTLDPIGVNVGDIIAITRVNVAVNDLASALGVNISLAGDIELYQYKIWSTNDAKAPNYANTNGTPIANGVSGLMSPWDKMQVNKIPTVETLSNNALARITTLQQRLVGLEQGMSPFHYPFVSLGHIGGDGSSATQELLNQALDDLVDATKTPDRGGVFRALYNGSQIIIEQYATNYATHRFIQVVRGSIGIDTTNTMKIGFRAYEFNMLYRTHNGAIEGFTEWKAMPTANTIASLDARIKALENK